MSKRRFRFFVAALLRMTTKRPWVSNFTYLTLGGGFGAASPRMTLAEG